MVWPMATCSTPFCRNCMHWECIGKGDEPPDRGWRCMICEKRYGLAGLTDGDRLLKEAEAHRQTAKGLAEKRVPASPKRQKRRECPHCHLRLDAPLSMSLEPLSESAKVAHIRGCVLRKERPERADGKLWQRRRGAAKKEQRHEAGAAVAAGLAEGPAQQPPPARTSTGRKRRQEAARAKQHQEESRGEEGSRAAALPADALLTRLASQLLANRRGTGDVASLGHSLHTLGWSRLDATEVASELGKLGFSNEDTAQLASLLIAKGWLRSTPAPAAAAAVKRRRCADTDPPTPAPCVPDTSAAEQCAEQRRDAARQQQRGKDDDDYDDDEEPAAAAAGSALCAAAAAPPPPVGAGKMDSWSYMRTLPVDWAGRKKREAYKAYEAEHR